MPEAVLEVAEADEPSLGQLLQELLADRPVQDRVRLLLVLEQEGCVEEGEVLDVAGKQAGDQDGHLDRAALECGDDLEVATQGTAREGSDLHLPAALLGHELGQPLGTQSDRVVGRGQEGELDLTALDVLRLGRARQQGRSREKQPGRPDSETLSHEPSPLTGGWNDIPRTGSIGFADG
jgi:hypothetical protein